MTAQIASLLADLRGTHETDEHIRASDLFRSMKVAGFDPAHPIKVRKSDGLLICGYHRTRCAQMLSLEPLKLFIDCTDEEAIQIAVRDNTYSTAPITMDRRKAIARQLYPAHTMQALADMLDVSKKTISLWLAEIVTEGNNSQRPKTATNPKGAGRPKKRRQPAPKHDKARDVVRPLVEAGEPINRQKLAAEHGLTEGAIQRAELAERARLEAMADPVIDPATLSLSAQEKLAAALRQQKQTHEREFQQRLEDGISKWIEETTIASFVEQYDKMRYDIERRGGAMTSRQYALVLSCLHPDSRHSLSDEKMAEAFRIFAALKFKLCDNKEVPVNFPPMPTTRAEWEARREAVRKQRRAARSASQAMQ